MRVLRNSAPVRIWTILSIGQISRPWGNAYFVFRGLELPPSSRIWQLRFGESIPSIAAFMIA